MIKKLILTSPGKIEVKNKIIPKINNDEILLQVLYCGICSSDLKFINKEHRINKYPITLGHEICGKVVKKGKNIKKFNNGDYLIFGAEVPCMKCDNCNKSETTNCIKQTSIGTNYNGGFTKLMKLSKKIINNGPIIKINKKINPKYACLSESVACVINGLEFPNFKNYKNKSLLILGSGYMGLLFTLLAKKKYFFKSITNVDFNIERLKLAKKLGANEIIHINKKNIEKKIKRKLYDFVVTANNNVESQKLSLNVVNKGGVINFFGGIPKSEFKRIEIDTNYLHYNQIKVGGTFSSDINHLKLAIKFIEKNQKNFDRLISKIININEIEENLKLLIKQKLIKVLVKL